MTLKQADGETPEEFQIRKLAFEQEQANGQGEGSEDYKNLQSFATKARQRELEVTKKLVDKDAKELKGLDTETQNKIIKELYGYDNLKELEIMLPDIFEDKDNTDNFEGDDLSKYKKRQELLEYKLGQKELDDEYDKFVSANEVAVKAVPNFKEKVYDELMNIKGDSKSRMAKATKIISSDANIDIEAFLSLQGRTNVKTMKSAGSSSEISERNANKLREALGLKTK